MGIEVRYDVIVVGAGHAGIEAAFAAARIGAHTLLLTQNLDTVGQMSCNPAIGGLAKGHMVREIDAMGGAMGVNADATGIQFRLLNRSKGPAVQAPRAQCDKKAYQFRAKWMLEHQEGLEIKQAAVSRVLAERGRVTGVETVFGTIIRALSVVITAGTFLRGLLHIGDKQSPGGRMADGSSSLSDNLRELGFQTARFKTGTPCRLHGRTINFAECQRQEGDRDPVRFSFLPVTEAFAPQEEFFTLNSRQGQFHVEQLPCWLTNTTEATHQIIRQNLHLSALYSGRIQGVGPRYCPSIEDKVVKFASRPQHQIYLEPEGRQTEEYYVNGLSTSLPLSVQIEVVRSMAGLTKAEIMRPGYAVEYDYFPPTQLLPTLETKTLQHLYFAGQINGTSGYEEAAAQGLMAGSNAALKVASRSPLVIERDEGYIGVLIDDLVNKGTSEPYRMFTSRAEHRLLLRHETSDLRLTPKAYAAGLASSRRADLAKKKLSAANAARKLASRTRIHGESLLHMMKKPDFVTDQLPAPLREAFDDETWSQVQIDAKYEGYITRQTLHLQTLGNSASDSIPDNVDYETVPGLKREARQELTLRKPMTLEQASKISGVTPSDLGILAVWLRRFSAKKVRASHL